VLFCFACQHVPVDPFTGSYDEARTARLAERVSANVACEHNDDALAKIACAAKAVQTPQPFTTPMLPAALLGVVVSVPESGPFRVRNDFGLPILTLGHDGATLTVLAPENRVELNESYEVSAQIYEMLSGKRTEPIHLPSDLAVELERAEQRGPERRGFERHETFAAFGVDARIFFLETFAGRPAYAMVIQGETEIQLAVFPVLRTSTPHPEFGAGR
jgi:hypothetical protein